MKVGTDAVVLGAWVELTGVSTILDIGAGSGVISLILAQRTAHQVHIDALELQEADARQAAENVARSPWPEKINVIHQSLQELQVSKTYDLIVSNPPYFNNSQLPPLKGRMHSRHTTTLPFNLLLERSWDLLNSHGKLAVILPYQEGIQFVDLAKGVGFHAIKRTALYSSSAKPQERWLLEFSRHPGPCIESSLTLLKTHLQRSEAYQELTKSLYL